MAREAWRRVWPLYLLWVLAFPVGMAWVETREVPDTVTICAFRAGTGLDCPSCGLTRAFRAMGRLQVSKAFGYNPLGPALFFGAVAAWGFAVVMLASRGRLPIPAWWGRWQWRFYTVALIIYLVIGIGRMAYQIAHPGARPPAATVWFAVSPHAERNEHR